MNFVTGLCTKVEILESNVAIASCVLQMSQGQAQVGAVPGAPDASGSNSLALLLQPKSKVKKLFS
jgi:hypothetical protein